MDFIFKPSRDPTPRLTCAGPRTHIASALPSRSSLVQPDLLREGLARRRDTAAMVALERQEGTGECVTALLHPQAGDSCGIWDGVASFLPSFRGPLKIQGEKEALGGTEDGERKAWRGRWEKETKGRVRSRANGWGGKCRRK
ncbi:hypothetical protein KIL84_020498 [Mauremys mutica]|uniref:Uncharacterized protein n=1 Tax=Mauremys mutica TaxID=74926 RepID=A0A9D3XUA3_9SAUR|nr:hypothetical protein KIL84_020498 [Mauremys mutica]